jgi:hypothetical protein
MGCSDGIAHSQAQKQKETRPQKKHSAGVIMIRLERNT